MLKLRNLLFLCLTLLSATAFTVDKSKKLPEVSGRTLSDNEVFIPKDLAGKYAVLGFAFTQKGELQLETWIDPMFKAFGPESMLPSPLFIIPMVGTSYHTIVKNKLKKSLDKGYYPYILFLNDGENEMEKAIGQVNESLAYILLVSPRGEILHIVSGPYDAKKIEAIADKIE